MIDRLEDLNEQTADGGDVVYTTENQKVLIIYLM